jgi:pimeloyl-ACP methyl ester carboxylesterase
LIISISHRARARRIIAGAVLAALPVIPGGAQAPTRNTVRTDDGFALVVWSKRPAGAPRGEIILLHGRTWSALPNFDLQVAGQKVSLMDALVAQGYAVYAVDQRGYGATRRDASGWLTPDRAIRDAANVVDWVTSQAPNHRAPALLGYSRGSMTAEVAAQRRPKSISALVLYGFPVDLKNMPPADQDPARPPRDKTTAEGAGEDFITPDSLPAGVKDAYVKAALKSDPVRADWRREHQWVAMDPAQLHTPTLFVNGERDPYATTASIPEFMTKMTGTDRDWVLLSHGDHVVHLERQPAFVRAIVSFLDRNARH